MSITQSNYGERFWDMERSMMKQMDKENAKRQYKEQLEDGDIEDGQTFEQWFESGNYDPNDWG